MRRDVGGAGDAAVGVTTAAPDSVAVAGAASGEAAAAYRLGFVAFDSTDPCGWLVIKSLRGWVLRTCTFCSQFSLLVCGLWFS